jgi:hypothetical protein
MATAGLEVDESALVGLVHAGTLGETEESVGATTDAVLGTANSKTVADNDGEDLVLADQLELLQDLELLDLVEESNGLGESGVGEGVDVEDTADAHQVESALNLPGEVELELAVTAVFAVAAILAVTVVLAVTAILAVLLLVIGRRNNGSVAGGRGLEARSLDGGRSLDNGSLNCGRSLDGRRGLSNRRLGGGNLGLLLLLLVLLGLGGLEGSLDLGNGATGDDQATALGSSAGDNQSRRQADGEEENVDRLHDDDDVDEGGVVT